MNRVAIKMLKNLVLILALLTIALVGTSSSATFNLQAGVLMKTMPDGRVVPMWGFGPVGGPITVPGPTLIVPSGDNTLTINLTNTLPVPVSIIVPGLPNGTVTPEGGGLTNAVPTWTDGTTGLRTNATQRVRSLTLETPPGQTWTYSWTFVNPGSHLYQSGTHQQVQVQMGLYGGVKKNFSAGQAYNVGTSAFANEISLLFSEIDLALHDAVANGNYAGIPASIPNPVPGQIVTSTIDHQPKYFLINGEPFSFSRSVIPIGNPGQRTLIRFLNAGYEDYVPVLQGAYMSVLAEDSHLYPFPKNQYSLQLSPGRTMDAIMINPATAGYLPLYDRRLHLTNAAASPGGMLVYLNIASDPQYTLTVSKAGTGTGKVITTSLPGGIDCGLDCNETMNSGVQVSLKAIADPGSSFTDWSGSVTATTSDVTVTMDSNKAVTATFTSGPTITLTSPNGGEIWARGTSHLITWTYTGDPGPFVRIEIVKGTSTVSISTRRRTSIPIGTGGTGSFNWNISRFFRTRGNDLKIKITSTTNPTVTDTSDNFFTVN